MKIRLIVIAAAILFAMQIFAQKQTVIHGNLTDSDFESAILFHPTKNVELAKTDVGSSGKFTLKAEIEVPDIYTLLMDNEPAMFLILEGDETVTITGKSRDIMYSADVEGSAQTKKLVEIMKPLLELRYDLDSLNTAYREEYYSEADEEKLKNLQEAYLKQEKIVDKAFKEAIINNKSSLLVFVFIDHFKMDENLELYKIVDEALYEKYPKNTYVAELHEKLQQSEKLSIGSVAPEIALPNPEGKIVKLSSFRGKYVLIDFWASWCRPCRVENPNVVKMYEKYKDKDFEIFGVSFDQNKASWTKAIEDDGIEWIQVSDLKGWKSAAGQEYNVSGIPHTILLDKEGKIIAKGLRGETLEGKLQTIFE